jgi:hypothetical protein
VSGTAFAAALYVGTAAVAVWVVVRFPRAAPSSLSIRATAPIAASFAVTQIRIDSSDPVHLYATVFLVAFPLLVAAWVSALWALQTLGELARR